MMLYRSAVEAAVPGPRRTSASRRPAAPRGVRCWSSGWVAAISLMRAWARVPPSDQSATRSFAECGTKLRGTSTVVESAHRAPERSDDESCPCSVPAVRVRSSASESPNRANDSILFAEDSGKFNYRTFGSGCAALVPLPASPGHAAMKELPAAPAGGELLRPEPRVLL